MERVETLARRLLRREKPREKPRGRWESDPDLAALPQEEIFGRLRHLTSPVISYNEKVEGRIHELLRALPRAPSGGVSGPREEAGKMVQERLRENPDYLDFKERRRREAKRQQRLRFKEQKRREALARGVPYWYFGLEEQVGHLSREVEKLKAEKSE